MQVPAQCVFHQQLLKLQVVLRSNELLLVRRHGTLSADHLDGRQASDLHLLLGVGKRLRRKGQGLFLYSHVLIREDQFPIHVFDLIHGRNRLQAKSDVRDLTIVLGDAYEPCIRQKPETLQNVLSKPELKAAVDQWAVVCEGAVSRNASVVKSNG